MPRTAYAPQTGRVQRLGETPDRVTEKTRRRNSGETTIVSATEMIQSFHQVKRYDMRLSMPRRTKPETPVPPVAAAWLLLIHQLPPKPAYLRVKVWRRLQGLGAIA